MADNEINEYIHNDILDLGCWHVWKDEGDPVYRSYTVCEKCPTPRVWGPQEPSPDYTQSLDLIAPVEADVIELVGE